MFQKKNELLQHFLTEFFSQPTMVILDESSKIKNPMTNRTPRLIEYTKDATYKVILTGTPWTESPLDIFAQMEFLHPGVLVQLQWFMVHKHLQKALVHLPQPLCHHAGDSYP
jgi:hypothetical protein